MFLESAHLINVTIKHCTWHSSALRFLQDDMCKVRTVLPWRKCNTTKSLLKYGTMGMQVLWRRLDRVQVHTALDGVSIFDEMQTGNISTPAYLYSTGMPNGYGGVVECVCERERERERYREREMDGILQFPGIRKETIEYIAVYYIP